MADRRLQHTRGIRAALAASLALAVMQSALAAPGYAERDTGVEEAPQFPEIQLDATDPAPPGAPAVGPEVHPGQAALRGPLITDADVAVPEVPAVDQLVKSGPMNAQVPGISSEDLARYKRQMLRKDI